MNGYRIRRAILKKISPRAFDHPLLAQLDAHQERIANDPEIQRRRAASLKEERKAMLVYFAIAAAIVSPAIWWIGARLVPALFF